MSVDTAAVETQYEDDRNLKARIALHARFSTNSYGWYRWVFDHLALPERARTVELGCGSGDLWVSSRDRVPSNWMITLSDFSIGMVRKAKDSLDGAPQDLAFMVIDAQAIPVPDGCLDAILANHMLYHVADRDHALQEMHRALKSHGCLYATTVGETHMKELWDLIEPFVPDIHDRTGAVSAGFTLENGTAQLSQFFTEVNRYDYPDDLAVTEVKPIIDYLRSSTTMTNTELSPNQWASIRRTVAAHIELKGAFHIHKASGLFVACYA
ncbi:MAG: class I SAM-dependent methyltransferase [Anaerolineae bacterium]